ncbi:testis-specific Y-encoded-like protein 4 isoform X7 [Chiroxiphia lanceolata]|uniref:testis-specific Y-encoded-like protein 4 isoform X7 n=1 Tax=Chiroxiphia lanceolata TaxID=296741 RepID=UPI0013CEFE3E|nr:testis-specific Y-encoded-like protein 4 isoform X7 [Chiroxiphia lanceolata]
MSGAGPGADLPPPAKLRRLDECSGTGPAAVVPPRREISHPPHPGEGRGARARGGGGGSGHARGGDARAPPGGGTESAMEGPETPEEGMETPKEGMETPKEGMEMPVKGMETPKDGLETPVKGLETLGDEKTPRDETETPKEGLETPKEGLKTAMDPRGDLDTTVPPCLEQENRGLETTMEVMETTRETMGDLGTSVIPCLEQDKGILETPLESRGSPESSREVPGTPNGRRGSLETAVSRCLEQGRRSKGGSETTSEAWGGLESDAPLASGGLKSTSRRKAGLKTPGRAKGSVETGGTQCLDGGRSGNGGLETPGEGLEATEEILGGLETTVRPKGSLESAVISHVTWDREQKEGLETTAVTTGDVLRGLEPSRDVLEPSRAVLGGLQPTPMACVGQSRGGPGLPEPGGLPGPVEVPDPPGVPLPKCQEAEESAVISVGEEEEEEEEEDGEEGPGRYLAALEAVQLQLEAVEEEAARAFRRLRARFGLRRRPHLQRRNRLIQHIPGFWVTAFLNHPQLSAMISDRDEDALSYMTSLQVEEFGQSRLGCRIRFFFSVNPYFQNDVVAKEFVRGPSGHLVSHSTPIRWWQGQDPRSRPHKGPPGPRSFFAWFGDHSFPAGDRVAEIIKEELWPNPLQFYLLGEGAEGPPDSESGEDCVVIEDDDEDVQEIPDDGDGSGVEEVLAEDPPEGRMDPAGGRT